MVQTDMIDTWLFTALVMGICALFVILRGIPVKAQDDRLVAGTVAVILISAAASALSIAFGTLMILDLAIVFSIIGFSVLIWSAKKTGADPS